MEEFLKELIKMIKDNRVKERVFELAEKFGQYGERDKSVSKYQLLDTQIRECALAAAGCGLESGQEEIWVHAKSGPHHLWSDTDTL